jgi:hypothetical protein
MPISAVILFPVLHLQQVKIVQFVPVLEDVPLNFRRIDPSDKVFHIPFNSSV